MVCASHGPTNGKSFKRGAVGSTAGSPAEKNDSGASTVESHGKRACSATTGPAKVIGCVTSRSAPATAWRSSSYVGRNFVISSSRTMTSLPFMGSMTRLNRSTSVPSTVGPATANSMPSRSMFSR